jgi:hypothetical protein
MAEYILIDEDYIKAYTPLTSAVDSDLIMVCALLAQNKYIRTRLGDALMRKIKTDAEAGTLTGLYATLTNDFVRIALAWGTMVELLPEMYVRKDNATPQIHTSENTAQIEQADLHRDISRYRDNMELYVSYMIDWLCVNGANIPEYSSNTAPDRPPTSQDVFNQNGLTISSGTRNNRPITLTNFTGQFFGF